MPSLLCPSPLMLDHSFPRTEEELKQVVDALSELQELLEKNDAHLVFTTALASFIERFDWGRSRECMPVLITIHNLLSAWVLAGNERIIRADVEHVTDHTPHPVPAGCPTESELVADWSDELGRLLRVHDDTGAANYFIGVACASAFSGGQIGSYPSSGTQARAFPLVGPTTISQLENAYGWDLPPHIHARRVSFASAKRNLHIIGATNVRRPSGGSHYIATFPGKRSWTLDYNDDPVPDTYLGQLVDIAGYPLDVIKFALTEGRMPQARLRIPIR